MKANSLFCALITVIGLSAAVASGGSSSNRTRRQAGGKCLMSGVCGDSMYGYIPCAKETEHHKFEDNPKALKVLKSHCPELFTDGVEVPEVCCTADELMRLKKMLKMIIMLVPGCPSCAANFRQMFCHLTCAPDQDQFMEIVEKGLSEAGADTVKEINYFINENYGAGAFDSCKNVLAMGVPLKQFVCRPYTEATCDHSKLFAFLGNDRSRKGYSPYQINFKFTSDSSVSNENGRTFQPANFGFKRCNEPATVNGKACPCKLCTDSCPTSR